MINPQPATVIPDKLNYVKVFTRFTVFVRNMFNGGPDPWTLQSDDQEIGEQIDDWIDQTKSLVISADTRTDISPPGAEIRTVIQTTSVIYTKAVDNHGREPRNNPAGDTAVGDVVPDIHYPAGLEPGPDCSTIRMEGFVDGSQSGRSSCAEAGESSPGNGPGPDDLPPAA